MPGLTYIFVKDDNDADKLETMLDANKFNRSGCMVVILDKSLASRLARTGIPFILLDSYMKEADFSMIRKGVLSLIENFSHAKILGNKSIIELLEYRGYSLWWFVRQGFYVQCSLVLKQIYSLMLIIRVRRIKRIFVLSSAPLFRAIIEELRKKSKVDVIYYSDSHSGADSPIDSRIKGARTLVLDFFPRIIRVMQGFFRYFHTKNNRDRTNILLFTQSHVWTNLASGIKGDANTYTILTELSKDRGFNVVPLDFALNRQSAWKAIEQKKGPFLPFDYFIFCSMLNLRIQGRLSALSSRLKATWQSLENEPEVPKALRWGNVSLYPILKPVLKNYFTNYFADSFISAARNLEIGLKIIKDMDIKAVICVDENGSSRFLVVSAHHAKVPSLAVQHGIIHPNHVSYNYERKDLHSYGNNLGCRLADKTAVFGSYFKNALMAIGHYPESKIVVTGQPRTDLIYQNRKNYSKKELYKRLSLDPEKKLVVFASGPLKELLEMETALTALAEELQKMKKVQLVIKLHPNDRKEYYDGLMARIGYKCVIIKDIDLYELLSTSDLVMSINSTVMLDALLFGKPVLQLNLLERFKIFGPLDNKLLTRIVSRKELSAELKKYLMSKSEARRDLKRKSRILSDFYMKIDGNATKRFITMLKSALNRKTSGNEKK